MNGNLQSRELSGVGKLGSPLKLLPWGKLDHKMLIFTESPFHDSNPTFSYVKPFVYIYDGLRVLMIWAKSERGCHSLPLTRQSKIFSLFHVDPPSLSFCVA